MRERTKCGVCAWRGIIFAFIFLAVANALADRTTRTSPGKIPRSNQAKQVSHQNDSLNLKPAADLGLHVAGAHKADALTNFVEGMAFEENGEMDRALEAYRKVLNVDPGQSELASRVADLLIRQEDFPQAIDILKDAIKANPNDANSDWPGSTS